MTVDLLLSSGFLAFGRHVGVLRAVDRADITVDAVVGTSSGALVGALWAAGHAPDTIVALLTRRAPLAWAAPHLALWRGLFRMDTMIAELRAHLPATFDGLARPLGVGVVDRHGAHRLLVAGDLPAAVAASCAIPGVFVPVEVDGEPLRDGAAVDRLGVAAWRRWRPDRAGLAHVVDRTHGAEDTALPDDLKVVRTPASGARLWARVEVGRHADEAEPIAAEALSALRPPAG